MIVCKFGGSSVCSKEALLHVKRIIEKNKERKFIIISAIGKRNSKDNKLTDLLQKAIEDRKSSSFNITFQNIKLKMLNFANELEINPHSIINFELFKKQIATLSVSKEFILSRGEYFTALICAQFLNAKFLDSKDLIVTSLNGRIDLLSTKQNLTKINQSDRYVIPGFYCANDRGEITLLGRGGSDTTGAIISACTNADLYENYTDVSGLLTIDNKLSQKAKTITQLSSGQLLNCVNGGANVYCQGAIPFFTEKLAIKNTFNNNQKFTVINKKSSFYYFDSIKKYIVFSNTKHIEKSRFIRGIFKHFTNDDNIIQEAIYIRKRLYLAIKTNQNFNSVDGIKLSLYGKYYNQSLSILKEVCKYNNIDIQIKKLPQPSIKTTINFFGCINKTFINEIISVLETKNTSSH